MQNLNLRELIYNYKTRNNGKWDKLTQQGVELLDQINLMYTYTDSFSKKLESIAQEIDSLLKIITLLCFISVAILVILQVIIGLLPDYYFLPILDIDTTCWICYGAALEVIVRGIVYFRSMW